MLVPPVDGAMPACVGCEDIDGVLVPLGAGVCAKAAGAAARSVATARNVIRVILISLCFS